MFRKLACDLYRQFPFATSLGDLSQELIIIFKIRANPIYVFFRCFSVLRQALRPSVIWGYRF